MAEAANALGVTRDAIHKRIRRGSIQHEKGDDGRFYVYIDTSTTGFDTYIDESKDESKGEVLKRLLDSQQEQIEFLRAQLAEEQEARRRADTIIAQLTQANATLAARMPELEAAPGERESRTEPAEPSGGVEVPQESGQGSERPWWRRWFGG